jgi:periplasmic protein TonB
MNVRRQLLIAVMLVAWFVQPALLFCQNDSAKDSSKSEKVYHVGRDGVTPPRVIYKVDPSYDDTARKAKLNGFVVLTLIVTPDGDAKNIRIVKSLSPGLDQKSIEAVSQWKFAPATKDGKPVAVELQVQTTFKLY